MTRIQGGMPPIAAPDSTKQAQEATGPDFSKVLNEAFEKVHGALENADQTSVAALVGEAQPHEAMIAMTKADIGFRFLVQTRNRAIEAYKEIMHLNM